jgi:hypothetical protein
MRDPLPDGDSGMRATACVWTACASISALLSSAGFAADLTTVARTGMQASPSGPEEFRRFLVDNINEPLPAPVINDNSACLFLASLRGPGATPSTDKAVFLRGPGGSRTVARKYTLIPGSSDVVFSEFGSASLAWKHDSVVLLTVLGGSGVLPGIDNVGVFGASWVTGQMYARMGDAAPDAVPAAEYSGFHAPSLPGESLNPIIPARVRLSEGGGFADGVWMPGRPNAARIQQFGPAPGTDGATFASYEVFSDTFGPVLYRGIVAGGDFVTQTVNGSTISNATGLWADTGLSTPFLVIRTAQSLTADPYGPVISTMYSGATGPASSTDGSVVFAGLKTHRLSGAQLGMGVWRWSGGVLTEVLGSATPIPDLPGVHAAAFAGSASGRVLFAGDDGSAWALVSLAGSGITTLNSSALVRAGESGPEIIARGGSQAPGCAEGQTFLNSVFGTVVRFAPSGKAAFVSGLQGPGVLAINDRGIWLADEQGVRLCLRKQDQIGAMKIVDFIGGGADMQVNELGQIVLRCDMSWVGDTSNTRYAAIVAWTPDSGASIVAVASQPLSLSDGATGPVLALKLGSQQAINNAGQIVFAAAMTSTSGEDQGIFRADLGTGSTPCPADHDGSGAVAVADIFAFLSDWFAGDADFDGSGATEVGDIFAFLAAWFQGCP